MNKDICLVIIFNHRYDSNIEKLKNIYKKRFSNIYFLVPFYDGSDRQVIPVWENSFQFQGYVAQGIEKFYSEDYKKYVFIGDDLILNPLINEGNIEVWFGIEHASFIDSIQELSDMRIWNYEGRYCNALNAFNRYNGVEWNPELIKMQYPPDLNSGTIINRDNFLTGFQPFKDIIPFILRHPKHVFTVFMRGKKLPYKIYCGYSDIFIIDKENIKDFARLCGIFAAQRLFVEIAIPTAMKMCCNTINTSKTLGKKKLILWDEKDKNALGETYGWQLDRLFNEWENNCLYIHPVKLSKWR